MGYGNVNISLALAEASLAKLGITNPTPEQLQAALNGGTVTGADGKTTTLTGILTLRSEGKGWGAIAKSLGMSLGQVVSASHSQKSEHASTKAGASAKTEKVAKADRVQRTEKVDRPQKVDRPEKLDRPQKVDRPEKVERPGR